MNRWGRLRVGMRDRQGLPGNLGRQDMGGRRLSPGMQTQQVSLPSWKSYSI